MTKKIGFFDGKNKVWTIVFVLILLAWLVWAMTGCERKQAFPDVSGPCPKVAAEAIALANASMLKGSVIEVESLSDSMGHAISQHAYLVIVDDWGNLEVGQVIAFLDEQGDIVAHMVTVVKPEAVLTQGINNSYTDRGYVDRKNYIGTVIAQVYHKEVG